MASLSAAIPLLKNCSFFSLQPLIDNSSSTRGGDSWAPPPSMFICWLPSSCAGLVQLLWVPGYNSYVRSGRQQSKPYHSSLVPIFFLLPFHGHYLYLGGDYRNIPVKDKHSIITFSQHFEQLWVSKLATAHDTKKYSLAKAESSTNL